MVKVADLVQNLRSSGVKVTRAFLDVRGYGNPVLIESDQGLWLYGQCGSNKIWNGDAKKVGPLLPAAYTSYMCNRQTGEYILVLSSPRGNTTIDETGKLVDGLPRYCPWEQYLAYLTHLGVQHELKTSYVPDLQEVVV